MFSFWCVCLCAALSRVVRERVWKRFQRMICWYKGQTINLIKISPADNGGWRANPTRTKNILQMAKMFWCCGIFPSIAGALLWREWVLFCPNCDGCVRERISGRAVFFKEILNASVHMKYTAWPRRPSKYFKNIIMLKIFMHVNIASRRWYLLLFYIIIICPLRHFTKHLRVVHASRIYIYSYEWHKTFHSPERY